jgi:cell division septal protein FtsQ
MSERKKQPSKPRLRKQPPMRRVYSGSAAAMPQLAMPKAAKKRKQRNSRQRISKPLASLKSFMLSARWISLAVAGACLYTLYLIGSDDRFYLNYIPVEGANTIQATTIVEASDLAGHHIFAADPQLAAEQINAVQGVITTTVTLHWPSDVMIRIREQPPLATWQEGEESFWVDENGGLTPARAETIGLLRIISEIPAPNLVRSSLSATEQADRPQAETTALEDVNEPEEETNITDEIGAQAAFVPAPVLNGALQLRQLRPNIDSLYYRPPGGLSYQDGRGWRAYFGTGEDMHQKLVVYETLVEDLMSKGLRPEYISVSNQYKPYYRLAP